MGTMMDELGFKITPRPRELTEEEVDKFKLRYYGGKKIKPSFEDTDNNWSAADTGDLPTYRLYSVYTNYIVVLKYIPDIDVWEKVKLIDIKNLNGFIWKMCYALNEQKEVSL
jgi:hypothetical protein